MQELLPTWGQIHRFLVDIKPGDYIVTPTGEHTLLRYGRVESEVYYKPEPDDGCPFPHRRRVDWAKRPLNSKEFPEKLYNAMKYAQLTVFSVHHRDEFLAAVVKALWPTAPLVAAQSRLIPRQERLHACCLFPPIP